jgi:starch-binding outer membrane protein, SusD/RagB family
MNNIMKKIKIYIIIVLSAFIVSCEDYLAVESPSVDDLGYVFSNVDDAQLFVNGIYQQFQERYTTWSLYSKFSTDVEMVSVGAARDNGRRDAASMETMPDGSNPVQHWDNSYTAINLANLAIHGITESKLFADKNPDMMHIYGEAVTLRAFWYFELSNHFGDVPFKTTPTRAGDPYVLPRTDRDEILTFLIEDMIAVEPYMKWARDLKFGVEQVSRQFTQALIARVALFRGGYSLRPGLTMTRGSDHVKYYEIANQYSKKVIESGAHKLNLSYSALFTNMSKLITVHDDDMIFEVAFGNGIGEIGYVPGKRVDAGNHPYGGGGGYYILTPAYIYSFDTLDVRLFTNKEEASIATVTKKNNDLTDGILGVNGIQVSKWCKYWMTNPMGSASSKGTGMNWPVMRYADVLLMYAETENELNNGPTEASKEALKTVRKRAFAQQHWPEKVDQYVNQVSANKETFFNAIVDERAWEFGGELVRSMDLVRWNLLKTKIFEARDKMIQMGKDAHSGTGEFAHLPDRIYWKLDPSTGKIDVKGLYRRLPNAPAGYTSRNWLRDLWNPTTELYPAWLNQHWRGVTSKPDQEARYYQPIPLTSILYGKGILSNTEYGWED